MPGATPTTRASNGPAHRSADQVVKRAGRSRADDRLAFDELFSYRLSVLTKLTERETSARYFAHTGLSLSEGRAMTIIAAKQPIRVQNLADYGSLDKSQASRVARSLLKKGLVEKAGDEGDRRASCITLTAKGRKLHAALIRLARQRHAEITGVLDERELRQLMRLIERLLDAAALDR